jgi:hypothetical protein
LDLFASSPAIAVSLKAIATFSILSGSPTNYSKFYLESNLIFPNCFNTSLNSFSQLSPLLAASYNFLLNLFKLVSFTFFNCYTISEILFLNAWLSASTSSNFF